MGLPLSAETIRVTGIVQGVGFRPTVWQLAHEEGVVGSVWNDAEGVTIEAWGTIDAIDRLCQRLMQAPPPLARIDSIRRTPLESQPLPTGFTIAASREGGGQTGVATDAATCPACLAELFDPHNRRYRYPFTNCTHCGPRLSIVHAIPYDRVNTSMEAFPMCAQCLSEYEDPANRRFHAQPNACPLCGPQLWLQHQDGTPPPLQMGEDLIQATARQLKQGAIVAIKGIGGFHLACDATNSTVVARLRQRKQRDRKPFALMAANINSIARYVTLGDNEQGLLQSRSAPIVILPLRHKGEALPNAIAPGQSSLGFMLPYTPLHHLLLQALDRPLVMTSGNVSSAPQQISNDRALHRLNGIADLWLLHDRDIVNRLDDSVVQMAAGKARILRRARGYAPEPLRLPRGFEAAPPLMAMGAELKNSFCLLQGSQAILSQHMGDLEEAATLTDYIETLALYRRLYQLRPRHIVVDRHPNYLSTQHGRALANKEGLSLIEVQHHHAHIAACMAEHQLPIDTPAVLGIALDGTGLGDDGTLWGGEFLLADYCGYQRLALLRATPMPGGTQAIREPWRNSYAQLQQCLGWAEVAEQYAGLDIVQFLTHQPLPIIDQMITRGVNSPLTSSCGRLFDAVAAVLGLCRQAVSYEGEAAIQLEALATTATLETEERGYPLAINRVDEQTILDPSPLWRALLNDLSAGVAINTIASRFHRGLAIGICQVVALLAQQHHFEQVVLSGGVWQNRLLLEQVTEQLSKEGYPCLIPTIVPTNDGGVALGQALVAAATRLTDATVHDVGDH